MEELKYRQVARLYNSGKERNKIAEELKITKQTLISYLSKARREGLIERVEPKEKTKVEQVAELYNAGIERKSIAKDLSVTKETVDAYISEARKKGLIGKRKTNFEKVVELYNLGKTKNEIVEDLRITKYTVKNYIYRAKKQGLINRAEPKRKTKLEQVAELYSAGKTKEDISEYLGITNKTVSSYLNKSIKQGLIEAPKQNKKSRYENLAELYNEGKTKKEIGVILRLKESTINDYLSKARKEGLIERPKKEVKLKFEQVADLYNEGKTIQEIAGYLNITVNTVTRNLNKARKQGLVEKPKVKNKSKFNDVIRLYNDGKTREKIAEELGISTRTVRSYLYKARREGLIEGQKVKKISKFKEVVELYNAGKERNSKRFRNNN